MRHPLMSGQRNTFDGTDLFDPFAGDPDKRAAQQALGGEMGGYQVAWPFTLLVGEDLDDFVGRWTTWLAEASTGSLYRPSNMSEREVSGSWRH